MASRRPPLQNRPPTSTHHLLCFKPQRPTSPFHPSDPSSPKVTCIGQVRAKTTRRKRRRRKTRADDLTVPTREVKPALRSRSLRRSGRRAESWVHVPFGCALVALKALGSFFCGLWRCGGGKWRSSCCCCSCTCEVCGEEKKDERKAGPAVLERGTSSWGLRELEMVADKLEKVRSMEVQNYDEEDDDDEDNDEFHEGGGSARSALLLMRCRSDPTKMSALAACFLDSGVNVETAEGGFQSIANGELDGDGLGKVECRNEVAIQMECRGGVFGGKSRSPETLDSGLPECEIVPSCESAGPEPDDKEDMEMEGEKRVGTPNFAAQTVNTRLERDTTEKKQDGAQRGEVMAGVRESEEDEDAGQGRKNVPRRHSSASMEKKLLPKEMEGSRRHSFSSEKDAFPSRRSFSLHREGRRSGFSKEKDAVLRAVSRVEPPSLVKLLQEEKSKIEEQVEVPRTKGAREKRDELPDCLLLMMYEPKLSMEVSRETWVCTGDFVRWQPHHWRRVDRKSVHGNREGVVEVEVEEELKGGSVRQCENNEMLDEMMIMSGPLVLTRCKSEPARPSSGFGVQRGCFWKSRYEPLGTGDVSFLAA